LRAYFKEFAVLQICSLKAKIMGRRVTDRDKDMTIVTVKFIKYVPSLKNSHECEVLD